MAGARKLSEIFYEIRARTEGLKRDLDDSERQFDKLTKFVIANPVAAIAAVGTAAAGVAIAATKMAATVETSLRKVAASVPAGAEGLGSLRKELERISVATGQTQEDLARAAEEIAKAGAGSAQEVGQRLRAVVDASQASGTDLASVISGLDQTLDLFGLSSADASAALAELFSVARGKSSLSDLFSQLQAAAPGIQKLGLDLPTAARALVQLGESGLSAKQAAGELKRLAEQGAEGRKEIERLASTIPQAVAPMQELAAAAARVNEATTNVGPRLRAELNAALITLGNELLPVANEGLQSLLLNIQRLRGGATADLKNAFASILVDGPGILKSLKLGAADSVLNSQTSGRFDSLKRSIEQLSAAAREGRVDLTEYGAEGLQQLAVNIARFSQTRVVSPEQRKELDIFLRQIAEAQTQLAKASGLSGRAGAKVSTVDFAAQARERAEAVKATRDLEQAFDDLFQKALRGDVTLSEFDSTVRDLGDGITDKLKKPTADQAQLFTILAVQADEVRSVLQSLTAQKAAREIERLKASLTPSLVDDFSLRLKDLADTLKELKAPPETVRQILGLQKAIADVAIGSQQLDERIAGIQKSAISSFDAQLGLLSLLQELETNLLTLQAQAGEAGQSEATEARIKGLEAQIEKLKALIVSLGGEVNSALDPSKAAAFATAIGNAADFALGVSTALLGADDSITRMIGAVGQVASGFAKIAVLAKASSGILKLFSTGAGITSALPALGAIIGGIGALSSLLGREDPAARALREALDRNARRLEELTSSVGELVSISVGGADAAAVRDLAITKVEQVGIDPLSGEPVFQDVRKSSAELLADLRGVGVSLKELQQIASDFGVSFANADLPTADEIRSLQLLISANGLKKLTDTLAGQLKLLDLQARIDPEAFAGIEGVIKRIAVLTGAQGVPALADALQGIDLSSVDGPSQAIEKLKQLLADFTAGDIDLTALGGLNPADFAETIAKLIEAIRSAAPAVRTPVQKFADALDAFGLAVELGTLTAEGKLAKAKELFATLFPDLADSVDTSSADAFRASIRGIIDGFAADGELTDAEKAQIDVLRALLGAFDGATGAGRGLSDALDVLADRFAIFGTSAAEQLAEVLATATTDPAVGKNAALGLLRGLTEGLDLATQEGQSALRDRARAIFEQLAEGGISAEEQVVIDLLKRILGLAVDVANEAAAAMEEEARSVAARIRAAFDAAEFDIALNGITDPLEILVRRARAAAAAIPELAAALSDLDLATAEGRKAAIEALIALGGASTDETLREAVLRLLQDLRGIPDPAAAVTETPATREPSTSAQSGVQQITERTGLQITELQRVNNRQNEVMIALLERLAGGAASLAAPASLSAGLFDVRRVFPPIDPSQLLRPPAIRTTTNTMTAGVVNNFRIQQTFTGPISTDDAAIVAAATEQSVKAGLQKALGTDLNDIRTFRGGWPS